MLLETPRLKIRRFKSTDWLPLYDLAMKWEASEFAKYDYEPWPDSQEEYLKIVEDFSKNEGFLAVILKGTAKFIGFIAVPFKKDGEYGFGFNFHPNFHGNGYATEACNAVLKYMFEELLAKRFTDGTALKNKPAYTLLTRLNFKPGKQKRISFRKDENGNPISFTGVEFFLTREDYYRSDKSKMD